MMLYNEAKDTEDRISKLYVLEGSRTIEVKELHAGDIGAIGKLNASTGDTLSTKANPIAYGKIEVSTPYTYKRYRAKVKGEEDKIAQALAKMAQEDLTLKLSMTVRTDRHFFMVWATSIWISSQASFCLNTR